MPVHIVQLGSDRMACEGPRIGTVRRLLQEAGADIA